ncbi:MAG: hypothetical protein GY784_00670, partial [Gammaproteobacteria bacterium]|nr:hypothetical protein [Gammaproteobacteria bacterium]
FTFEDIKKGNYKLVLDADGDYAATHQEVDIVVGDGDFSGIKFIIKKAYKVSGKITGLAPGKEATLTLTNNQDDKLSITKTKITNSYELPKVAVGEYTLTLKTTGDYTTVPSKHNIIITNANKTNIDFAVTHLYKVSGDIVDLIVGGKATITLFDDKGNKVGSKEDISNGTFTFEDIKKGNYKLVLDADGDYAATHQEVDIVVGDGDFSGIKFIIKKA